MKAVATVVLASLALAGTCHGGEVVRELPWTRPPAGATLVAPGAGRTGASIRIERRAGGLLQVLRLENPPIATPVWAVVGEVRYEGVAGDGYLEMWSVFKEKRHRCSLPSRTPMRVDLPSLDPPERGSRPIQISSPHRSVPFSLRPIPSA